MSGTFFASSLVPPPSPPFELPETFSATASFASGSPGALATKTSFGFAVEVAVTLKVATSFFPGLRRPTLTLAGFTVTPFEALAWRTTPTIG